MTERDISGNEDRELRSLKGWPNPGDKMRFLGANGYDHDLAAAFDAGFSACETYTVKNIDVGDWQHTIEFEEIPGRFNGVMFKAQSKSSEAAVPIVTTPDINKQSGER
jgi:hypothetical protein